MKIVKQDWFSFVDVTETTLLWTGNMTVTKHNNAVMGAGLAKQVLKKFPGIQETLASNMMLYTKVLRTDRDKYGNVCFIYQPKILFVGRFDNGNELMMFPVKYGWWQDADIDMIISSSKELNRMALENTNKTFVVNFPGIGAGHLSYDDVLEVIEREVTASNIIVVTK